ncbi:nucleoside triphosphate pyrophosphohydrolase [Nocardioides ultimimeridianus]
MSGGDAVAELVAVMRRQRARDPWKQAQTHRSLARYLLEETHETLEAIDRGDHDHLREELGDLLLQVVFHAVIAEEAGVFDLDEVARGITEKLIRRNPHIDDGAEALTIEEVDAQWQRIKAAEKGRTSPEEGIPPTLPALLYADKLLGRLADEGRPAEVDPAAADLGERLLALVAEAREAGVDPEQALRDVVRARLSG